MASVLMVTLATIFLSKPDDALKRKGLEEVLLWYCQNATVEHYNDLLFDLSIVISRNMDFRIAYAMIKAYNRPATEVYGNLLPKLICRKTTPARLIMPLTMMCIKYLDNSTIQMIIDHIREYTMTVELKYTLVCLTDCFC